MPRANRVIQSNDTISIDISNKVHMCLDTAWPAGRLDTHTHINKMNTLTVAKEITDWQPGTSLSAIPVMSSLFLDD